MNNDFYELEFNYLSDTVLRVDFLRAGTRLEGIVRISGIGTAYPTIVIPCPISFNMVCNILSEVADACESEMIDHPDQIDHPDLI